MTERFSFVHVTLNVHHVKMERQKYKCRYLQHIECEVMSVSASSAQLIAAALRRYNFGIATNSSFGCFRGCLINCSKPHK